MGMALNTDGFNIMDEFEFSIVLPSMEDVLGARSKSELESDVLDLMHELGVCITRIRELERMLEPLGGDQ